MILKNIVVVGGGTSGWLTALWLKNNFKKINITVVESEEIDILGVGEGGVPIVLDLFKRCNLDIKELFRETNSTLKVGLKLVNWNGNQTYLHPFSGNFLNINDIEWPDKTDEDQEEYNIIDEETGESIQHIYETNKDIEIKDFYKKLKKSFWNRAFNDTNEDFTEVTSVFPLNDTIPNFSIEEIHKIAGGEEHNTGLSLHFDAVLLGKYLKKKAIEIGVTHIQDTVLDVIKNEEELIEKIVTKKGDEYFTDLVFDCTGQSRMIISSFNDYDLWPFPFLTVNSALSFNLPVDENLSCWTEAIAMDYGWMWKIPLQNRIGCGYVFDDRYLDFEYAKKEIEGMLGHEIEVQRELSFYPGYVDKPWNRNCIAIGMSQSFVEPLEATAIGSCVIQLYKFTEILNSLLNDDIGSENMDEMYVDDEYFYLKQLEYNEDTNNLIREIADFLLLHYYVKRNDTDFWELRRDLFEFKETIEEKESESDGIEENMTFKMMVWNKYPIYYSAESSMIFFDEYNFMCIFDGLNIYDKVTRNDNLEGKEILDFCTDQNYEDLKNYYIKRKEFFFKDSLKQLDYLKKYELLA